MNARHCCQIKTRAGDNVRRPASRLRRGGEIAGWIVPGVTLALLPKCPVCVGEVCGPRDRHRDLFADRHLPAGNACGIVRGAIGFHYRKTTVEFNFAEIQPAVTFVSSGRTSLGQRSVRFEKPSVAALSEIKGEGRF